MRRSCSTTPTASRAAARASLEAPYKANLGPHVLYSDGALWGWLKERDLLPPSTGIPYTGLRLRWDGAIHRTPPLALIPSMLKLRGRRAPADESFRAWASSHAGERTAEWLSALAGVYTYHHDPGRAVRRVRLGAHEPAGEPAALRAVPDRRLERARARRSSAARGSWAWSSGSASA